MNKKLKYALLVIGTVAALCSKDAFAKDALWMSEDSYCTTELSEEFIVEDEHILIPLRAICERMGYEVFWDDEARQVRVKKDFKDILYTIDKNQIAANNIRKNVDVAPRIIHDRTYITEEAFNKGFIDQVMWDSSNRTFSIQADEEYVDANWQDIVDLNRTYEKKDENEKVLAQISVTVPQIVNYNNDMALDKINDYYKIKANEMFDEYMKLMEDDLVYNFDKKSELEYSANYYVAQNSSGILSVVNVYSNKQSSFMTSCDVFNTTTGEKLSMYDVLDETKEEIDKIITDGMTKELKKYSTNKVKEFDGDLSNVEFYLNKGDAVFLLNPVADVIKIRLNVKDNKDLFKIKAYDSFNYDEELMAKKVAMNSCDKYTKFVEKTTLGTDECYVFEKHRNNNGERIAVNRSRERIYRLKKKDGMYYVMSNRRIKDEVSDRDAIKLVRDRVKNKAYETKIYGHMRNNLDGEEYSIVNVKNLEGTVSKKFAVSRKDGSVYIEQKKVTPTIKMNEDGTISAVGFFEIDEDKTSKDTDISKWGTGFKTHGSYMLINENGVGTYNIGVSADVEHFKLVNEDGKNYIEITNEEGSEALQKGTRFLVEVQEIEGVAYLYVHDEDGKDSKPGNKCWKLDQDNRSVYIDKDAIVPALLSNEDGTVTAVGCFRINNDITSKETDTSKWGTGYVESGSYMMIENDGKGTYSIGVSADVEHFRLVNEDGKTYMEITNEEGSEALPKGTRFLVEIREIDGVSYLCVHDEDGKDSKPGNKYWELEKGDALKFEPYGYHNKI